ncbi:MAG: glycosyltransferase family 39 protein [Armatimonadetes bacterium]|nr:glycosyltransferase family 39 protein [Armatimonadota bacterium]
MECELGKPNSKATRDERFRLGIILLAYGVLASCYLVRVPLGRQPDETAHLQYIEHLAKEHRFPIFHGREEGIYEAHQPPLYYLLCVPSSWVAGRISINAPAYAARLVSLLAGLVLVFLTHRIARKVRPDQPSLALTVAAFTALLPMHLNVSASVGNDALAGMLCAFVLLLLLHGVPERGEWKRDALIGLSIGLGLLTKTTCLLLLPLAGMAFLLQGDASSVGLRRAVRDFAIVVVVAALVSGGWLVRNTQLYGDPFALHAFNEGFKSSPHPSFFLQKGMSLTAYVLMVLQLTYMTFWGIFGEVNQSITRLSLMYAKGEGAGVYCTFVLLFAVLSVSSLMGMVLPTRRQVELGQRKARKAPTSRKPMTNKGHLAVLALGVLLVAAQFVQFNLTYFQAQARYLHPMLPAISCLFAMGAAGFPGEKWRKLWTGVMLCGLLCSSFFNLTVWLQPVHVH